MYFKITQTSAASNENSLYKCEVSSGNTDNFTLQCSNKGFGDSFDYNNVTVFGGVEFFIDNSGSICFHEDTDINTDQGVVKIKNLKSYHTLRTVSLFIL